ncbi:hypothetical protein C6525_28170 [Escherichia coli]|nr:hypothetical protein [Escherichia coli]
MLPSETMIWQPEFTDKTLSRKPGAVHCDKLTAGSKITTECPSESFVGSRKHNELSTSAKAMSMSASARSNSFVVNSGK